MIEPSYGRNLKSYGVFLAGQTCYMRQCVDKTVVSNNLRLEIDLKICFVFGCRDDHVYTLFSPRCFLRKH